MFSLSNYMHFVRNHSYFMALSVWRKDSVDDGAIGEWRSGNDLAASDNNLKFAWKDWDKIGKQLY
jgi:hypothetical protein